MLARVDAVDLDIAAVDAQIGQHLAPFADAVARLDEIPGIGPTATMAFFRPRRRAIRR